MPKGKVSRWYVKADGFSVSGSFFSKRAAERYAWRYAEGCANADEPYEPTMTVEQEDLFGDKECDHECQN